MLQFLAPKFIKEFDKKLLLNYPFWYIVKIHYILYFTILMWLLSYGIGCALPIDITNYNPTSGVNIWIFVFAVLGIILFCVWIYYLTIYNNEDHFGKYKAFDDVKFLGIFMVGILLIMSFSYPMQIRMKTRLANTFTDLELAQQYNTLNLANKYVTTDLEDFQYCGYDIHATVDYDQLRKDSTFDEEGRNPRDLKKYNRFEKYSGFFRNEFDFNIFFSNINLREESSEYEHTFFKSKKIEQEYNLHRTDGDKLNAIKNLLSVSHLYQNTYYIQKYSAQDYLDNYNHIDKTMCTAFFPNAFNLDADDKQAGVNFLPVNDVMYYMGNIYKAKFSLPSILTDGYLLFSFYFSFLISLLIIVFRNDRWQHYLVSIVSFILLGIIIGIISLAASYPYSKNAYPTLALLAWLTAAVISLIYYFKKDKYRVVGAVATNLFYVCLPIMPLIICAYSHEVFDLYKCNYDYSSANSVEAAYYQLECAWMNKKYDELICYAQLIGIAGFIFGVMPFYKVFFAKQKALPRDK